MRDALRVLWRAGVQFERYGWLYVVTNLMAVALSIPIITAPAAFAGLSRLSHTAQTGLTATYADFWQGVRDHFWRGIIAGIANVIVPGILWANFYGYRNQTDLLAVWLRLMWIVILVFWLGIQLYLWPMLEEMQQPNLRGAVRNAAIMLLQNPLFSLTLLVAVSLIAAISTALIVPWLLFSESVIACIANAAVLNRLEKYRAEQAHLSQ